MASWMAMAQAADAEQEMPHTSLVAAPGARHIPMEDDPERTALADFFAET